MAKITYVEADGSSNTIEVPTGWSLMQGAVSNGVKGIVGESGGSMACATCHCYVDPARFSELPKADASEIGMLELAAADVKPNSRLSCQITSSPKLDGLVLYLPATQH